MLTVTLLVARLTSISASAGSVSSPTRRKRPLKVPVGIVGPSINSSITTGPAGNVIGPLQLPTGTNIIWLPIWNRKILLSMLFGLVPSALNPGVVATAPFVLQIWRTPVAPSIVALL